MFGRKKEKNEEINLYQQQALELSHDLNHTHYQLVHHAQDTYLMIESCKILIGADLKAELERVEQEKETLRNYIASYDIQRKELNDYIKKHNLVWSIYPSDSHTVIRIAIKSLFNK